MASFIAALPRLWSFHQLTRLAAHGLTNSVPVTGCVVHLLVQPEGTATAFTVPGLGLDT